MTGPIATSCIPDAHLNATYCSWGFQSTTQFVLYAPSCFTPDTYLLTITGFRLARYHHHLSTNVQPSLLTSCHTDPDPALSQPRPEIIFHLRHPILPLSTSFAQPLTPHPGIVIPLPTCKINSMLISWRGMSKSINLRLFDS